MTKSGGAYNLGVLFEYDPLSDIYTKKIDFDGSNNGSYPFGSLILYQDQLYGMATYGGVNGCGVIFVYDPATSTYTKKKDFDFINGSAPYGSFTQYNGKMYGLTYAGGTSQEGVIFEWDPISNTLIKKLDFDGPERGNKPDGSLTFFDGMFYGMTLYGGSNNLGVAFEWNPNTNNFTKLLDFNGINGSYPVYPQFSVFTTQASSITFSKIQTNELTFNWIDGNGSKRAVFVKRDSEGSPSPVNNSTYNANTSFGSGSQIGTSGWYCVFNGTTHSSGITITNLIPNTTYRVMVCEYDGNSGNEQYKAITTIGNPQNQTTLHDQATSIDISLTTGWNIISFAAEPDNMSLMSIVTPLKNAGTLVKIQDEKGNAIEQLPAPIGWVDNIGLMKVSEGYKIKVSANTMLSATGKPVTLPYNITLATGWNIMGYPSITSQAAMAAFQPLIDAGTLLKVQDEKGNAIEKLPAPIGWIDNIHNLLPGEGYKIKTNAGTTLTINNSGKGENQITETAITSPAHFKPIFKGNGLDQMNIYVKSPTIDGVALKAGDEMGVFDGGRCVGAVVVDDPNLSYYTIIASLDDPTTKEADGFTEGNIFNLKVWNAQTGLEGKVKQEEYQKGYTKYFEKLGTSVLKVDFTKESFTVLGDAFPNPSKDKTTFSFQLAGESKVRLELYNIKGDLVKVLLDRQMPGGTHQVEWDNMLANGNSASSGIYFYRLKLNNFMKTKQLVIR
jgi:uncharacterized repeat protein (TIGR03803 family)